MTKYNYPTVQLGNGIRVANFCFCYKLNFSSGEVLESVTVEMADSLCPSLTHEKTLNPGGWTDVSVRCRFSDLALEELRELAERQDINIVLVPPAAIEELRYLGEQRILRKARTCVYDMPLGEGFRERVCADTFGC